MGFVIFPNSVWRFQVCKWW